MRLQPGQQLAAAGVFRLVGTGADERHTVVSGREQPDRIAAPGGAQHDLGAGPLQQLLEARQQLLVDDVGKATGVGSLVTVQHAVDVEKDYFHGTQTLADASGSDVSSL